MRPSPRIAGLVLLAAWAASASEPPAASKPDPALVRKLLDRLGSEDYETREAATRDLASLNDIPDELRTAADSSDPEVGRRAQRALKAIVARVGDKKLDALVAKLRKEPFGKIVRRAAGPLSEHDAALELVDAMSKVLAARANELGGATYGVPELESKSLGNFENNDSRNCRILIGEKADRPALSSVQGCLVVCAGDLPRVNTISNSIVFVDGNFGGASQVVNSLLVVRGNVGAVVMTRGSVVLASGDSEGSTILQTSFFQIGGKFGACRTARNNVYVKTAPEIVAGGPAAANFGSKTLDGDGPLQSLNFGEAKAEAAKK